ncbi:MAG: PrgI family protein [Parcubacteria group bacterium]|nr:PrgI family protein [Parcubacteria group bacterium]
MPQFVVPQFIDVEDKIIGPITTRQFIMGVAAALLVFLSYKFADAVLFAIEALFIVGVYVLTAFIKVNGQPFYQFALSIVRSLVRSQLRVWSKAGSVSPVPKQKSASLEEEVHSPAPKHRPRSRTLSELSLLVDTGGKYRPEEILAQSRENQHTHAQK